MKKDKIIYWITTGIVTAMMLFSAFGYLTMQQMKDAFVHLGFPDYFRKELAFAKILGALALILPMVPNKIKEAAYVGFAITFVSAVIAHFSSGDGIKEMMMPLIFLVILGISAAYYCKVFCVNNCTKKA